MILFTDPKNGKTRVSAISRFIEAVELGTTEPGWVVDRLLHGATIHLGVRYWLHRASAYELNELRQYIESKSPEPVELAGHPGVTPAGGVA